MNDALIYKIATHEQWEAATAAGVFHGAPVDLADGYIHFSTAEHVRETAAKHFAGQIDLVLVAVDAAALGYKLIYEVSRGDALFPHLYAPLNLEHVVWVKALPIDASGIHQFPDLGG
jgi:uncharacterized protein (DUF952 family)